MSDSGGLVGTPVTWVEIARDALRSIMSECENHRYGSPSYDIRLDHIYDCAKVADDEIARAGSGHSPEPRDEEQGYVEYTRHDDGWHTTFHDAPRLGEVGDE